MAVAALASAILLIVTPKCAQSCVFPKNVVIEIFVWSLFELSVLVIFSSSVNCCAKCVISSRKFLQGRVVFVDPSAVVLLMLMLLIGSEVFVAFIVAPKERLFAFSWSSGRWRVRFSDALIVFELLDGCTLRRRAGSEEKTVLISLIYIIEIHKWKSAKSPHIYRRKIITLRITLGMRWYDVMSTF